MTGSIDIYHSLYSDYMLSGLLSCVKPKNSSPMAKLSPLTKKIIAVSLAVLGGLYFTVTIFVGLPLKVSFIVSTSSLLIIVFSIVILYHSFQKKIYARNELEFDQKYCWYKCATNALEGKYCEAYEEWKSMWLEGIKKHLPIPYQNMDYRQAFSCFINEIWFTPKWPGNVELRFINTDRDVQWCANVVDIYLMLMRLREQILRKEDLDPSLFKKEFDEVKEVLKEKTTLPFSNTVVLKYRGHYFPEFCNLLDQSAIGNEGAFQELRKMKVPVLMLNNDVNSLNAGPSLLLSVIKTFKSCISTFNSSQGNTFDAYAKHCLWKGTKHSIDHLYRIQPFITLESVGQQGYELFENLLRCPSLHAMYLLMNQFPQNEIEQIEKRCNDKESILKIQ